MGVFGFLKKKEETEGKFKDKVIDEIDKLNQEFSSEVPEAPQPDAPPPVEPASIEEPKDIEEEMAEKKEDTKKAAKAKPKKAEKETKKEVKKEASTKEMDSFNQKLDKIKKRLGTSKAGEEMKQNMEAELGSVRDEFNGRMNQVIEQIRDLNLVLKNVDVQQKQLNAMQTNLDELTAHIDEMGNQIRELDKIDPLRKEMIAVKNGMRSRIDLQDSIDAVNSQISENRDKINQMLAIVEALTE